MLFQLVIDDYFVVSNYQEWISPGFLVIDQGPIAPMIENHRTGLLWKGFMRSEVGIRIIQKIRIARPVAESFDSLRAYHSI